MRMPASGNPKKDREIVLKAFHPAYKLKDIGRTPPAILQQARHIALANGLKHVYLGNVHDREGGITACACPHCRSRAGLTTTPRTLAVMAQRYHL